MLSRGEAGSPKGRKKTKAERRAAIEAALTRKQRELDARARDRERAERETLKYPYMTGEEKLGVIVNARSLREDARHNRNAEASAMISREMEANEKEHFGELLGSDMWTDVVGAPIAIELDASMYAGAEALVVARWAQDMAVKIARTYKAHFRRRTAPPGSSARVQGLPRTDLYLLTRRERRSAAIRLQRLQRRRIHVGETVAVIQTAFRMVCAKRNSCTGPCGSPCGSEPQGWCTPGGNRGRRHAVSKLQRWFRYRQRVYVFACAWSIQHKFRRWSAGRRLRNALCLRLHGAAEVP